MDMSEFDDTLDSAETDPRPKWKAAAKRICEQELAGVPGEIAEEITRAHLRELGKNLRQCFEEHRITDGNQWIAQLALGLRNAIRWERQQGRLKPVNPTSEIERSMTGLQACAYTRWPLEIDSLLALLKPGERILEIGIRTLKTSHRTIGRGDLVNVLKPSTQTNLQAWANQFPSDHELRELEAAEGARQNPKGLYSENYNRDLPSPFLK